ncbi:MBL fold metallo-hydrolase [Streptomyces leeuwenhoekii]|uniref:MBL fold metallo-hydrolase n=1 Tax=Streptomyces leeuwenhoekii TaxID=1437453 RepID=UPI00367E220E
MWIVGDDREVVVIDAAAIAEAVGDRPLVAVLCTHAPNDHVGAAPALAEATGALRRSWTLRAVGHPPTIATKVQEHSPAPVSRPSSTKR